MKIVANGVKGYLRKKETRMKSGRGRRIHLTAEESQGNRIRKRLLGKSSRYKKRSGAEDTSTHVGRGGDRPRNTERSEESSLLKTRAVLLFEQSPQGELARRMRGLETTLGYRIKVDRRVKRSLHA